MPSKQIQKILVLGGTGAMGSYLVKLLSKTYCVVVTSRKYKDDSENIRYIQGDAHDITFLQKILKSDFYVAIIDFMNYSTDEYSKRYEILLDATQQLFFISSARVYSNIEGKIVESSSRLLDISDDNFFLSTDDYALAKARQEDLLLRSSKRNYTIIRPYMSYSPYRMDIGFYPKELWLYRVLKGKGIVFPADVYNNTTTLTSGLNVSEAICSLIGCNDAIGEIFHITADKSYKWKDIINAYVSVLKNMGYDVKLKIIDKPIEKEEYIYIYDRLFNRSFNNNKINKYIDTKHFVDAIDGVSLCMTDFLKKPMFNSLNWRSHAFWDRCLDEFTPLCDIPSIKDKIKYLFYRYLMSAKAFYVIRGYIKKLCK